jgi:TPR repeat protein
MAHVAGWTVLQESALSGDEVAAFELAMCHASGSGGLSVDLTQAHRWFNVAAALGYAPALSWRAEIAGEMVPRQVADAQRLARATLGCGMARAA